MRLKTKNRSHRYGMDRPKTRHGYKYTKYKICLSIMMVACIKQHLSKIWSSIHEKVQQHWGWIEKSINYKKNEACVLLTRQGFNLVARSIYPNRKNSDLRLRNYSRKVVRAVISLFNSKFKHAILSGSNKFT